MIKTILGVFPHPDDEISAAGLFQRAIKKGIDLHIICATRGEAGRIKNRKCQKSGNIIEIRTNEIKECCNKLGVLSLEFLDLKDNKADTWVEENGQEKLHSIIQEINPDLVITFDKNGVNGHPDHKQIHRLTNNTFDQDNNRFVCYVTVFPKTFMKRKLSILPLPTKLKKQMIGKYSTNDELVSFMIRLNRSELKRKLDLLKCYSSQFPDDKGKYYGAPLLIFKNFAKYEFYYVETLNPDIKSIFEEIFDIQKI